MTMRSLTLRQWINAAIGSRAHNLSRAPEALSAEPEALNPDIAKHFFRNYAFTTLTLQSSRLTQHCSRLTLHSSRSRSPTRGRFGRSRIRLAWRCSSILCSTARPPRPNAPRSQGCRHPHAATTFARSRGTGSLRRIHQAGQTADTGPGGRASFQSRLARIPTGPLRSAPRAGCSWRPCRRGRRRCAPTT